LESEDYNCDTFGLIVITFHSRFIHQTHEPLLLNIIQATGKLVKKSRVVYQITYQMSSLEFVNIKSVRFYDQLVHQRYLVNTIENVLILQGGGSLGAFGCGVFKALAKSNIKLDITAGTSIGGLNASLIAGSKEEEHPESALEQFWLELAEGSIDRSNGGKRGDVNFNFFSLAEPMLSSTAAVPYPPTSPPVNAASAVHTTPLTSTTELVNIYCANSEPDRSNLC
jgi:hypothetical protein